MTCILAFVVGLAVGLLLNWRSWKALDAFAAAAIRQRDVLDKQKATIDLQKDTNDTLWRLLDADKIRH